MLYKVVKTGQKTGSYVFACKWVNGKAFLRANGRFTARRKSQDQCTASPDETMSLPNNVRVDVIV
jgi:hypothetical protein